MKYIVSFNYNGERHTITCKTHYVLSRETNESFRRSFAAFAAVEYLTRIKSLYVRNDDGRGTLPMTQIVLKIYNNNEYTVLYEKDQFQANELNFWDIQFDNH